jgi:hypothetical protein
MLLGYADNTTVVLGSYVPPDCALSPEFLQQAVLNTKVALGPTFLEEKSHFTFFNFDLNISILKQTMDQSVCVECAKGFEKSKKTYVDLAYCKDCRKNHSKDILEIVTVDEFRIFDSSQIDDAEAALSELEADFRLDLHLTLDTIPIDAKLPGSSCCVSYVGQLTTTRISAREEIQERIKSGQLLFGALVFARGPRKNPDVCNAFKEVGSKAWFNLLVKSDNPLFVDDSDDHVLSVESVGIRSIQIYPDQNLLDLMAQTFSLKKSSDSSSDDSLFG